MRGALATGLLMVTLAISVQGQTPAPYQLKGTIKDSGNAVISGAYVLIHWDSAGSTVGLADNVGIKQDVVVKTDDNGSFSVNLPPGFYDVLVTAPGFSPQCQKIRLRQVEENYYNVRLNVSRLVSTELGHKIATPK